MPTVLVAGANRGLGLEFVRQYAADGWEVIAGCRDRGGADELSSIKDASDGRVVVERLDVLNFSTTASVAKDYKGRAIDVLINNAGEMGPKREDIGRQSFGSMDYGEWARIFRTNVFGPMKVSETFVDSVAASDQKKIVHISSTIGSNVEGTRAQVFCYGPSKAALNKVSTLMAEALRDRGITVAALCPGHVKPRLGGLDAKIEPADSIGGMRKVIAGLTLEATGAYIRYTGETVAF
jgi:NAD(P)-dependent dehydrogenase (short-subunit alcohol dehydrogenase family)